MSDYTPNANIPPCKGCEKRCVTESSNCHSSCEDYLAYKSMRSLAAVEQYRKQVNIGIGTHSNVKKFNKYVAYRKGR